MEVNFVDYVKVCCRSGKGGDGSVHFHRAKYIDKGGPDGGNGGRGGHIVLRGNRQIYTLIHLKYRKHILAANGANGMGALKTGKDAKDEILEVPIGTVVKNPDTGEVIGEILKDGQKLVIAKGGRGGLGNDYFKNSTQQTPRYAQQGEEGEEEWRIIELKILADVGLVGFPNAGKSSLLAALSAAKPKIADYPFTTLIPNLGMVPYRDFRSFAMADIPGIIKGASKGKGLGIRFLRHIERNPVLLFLIPADSLDIVDEYDILLDELCSYNQDLIDKKIILGISKSDLLDEELTEAIKENLPEGVATIFFSSHHQKNLVELKDMIWNAIQEVNQ